MLIHRRHFGACVLGGLAGRLVAANRPKILVLIVLEQFRPDYIDAHGVTLGTGGFRRLLEKGAWFSDCRHLASTFSATALTTIATGAWPAEHGIVADSWYDRAAKRPVHASDEMLLATTLASQVAADSQARVSVIGMDSAQARLFAGTRDANVYWMGEQGQYVMRGEAPDWLEAFNNQRLPESFHDRKWFAMGARPDAPPLRTLVFDEKNPEQFLALYQSSPFAQEAQFDLLHELISRDLPAQGDSYHLICLLAGSMARLGYETGGVRSRLMEQMTLQLDHRLDLLLSLLSKAVGETGFGVVVTGAHGAPPAPSPDERPRLAVKGEEIAGAIDRAISANGLGHVEKYLYPFLYLDTSGFRDPDPIRLAAARAALEQPAVADFYSAAGICSTRNQWEQRFRNSFHAKRSGDLMLSYRPEYIEDFGQGRGISYGSLYNYDVRVPLCFYGPQFSAGIYDTPVESVDVAPTLARLIGVSPPSSSVGRVLSEALA